MLHRKIPCNTIQYHAISCNASSIESTSISRAPLLWILSRVKIFACNRKPRQNQWKIMLRNPIGPHLATNHPSHMRATGNFVHIKKVFLNLGPNLASGWEGESMGPTHLRSAPWWKCVYILYLIHQIYTKPYHGVFTFSALYLNKSVNDRDQTATRKLLGLPPTLEIFVKKWDNIWERKKSSN